MRTWTRGRRTGASVSTRTVILATALVLLAASSARAELVFFSTGRVMSVAGHRVEGDRLVLLPRDGGEIELPASVVARIEPDEVPYPEPRGSTEDSSAPRVAAEASPDNSAQSANLQSDQHVYDPIIERASAAHGVDAKLVRAVIQVESGYEASARSQKGAMGLMQLMPETARQYAVADPYDPASNIEAGITHLKSLLDRFPLQLALAAYNAGEATVERFRGIPPYQETRDYVARILQLVNR